MQLKRILSDDDAVSPVIGVILMVAITVILAAVIATFVLGLGEQVSSTAPTASFTFEYSEGSGNTGLLTVTHDGGDAVKANELYIRGSKGASNGQVNDAWADYNSGSSVSPDITASTVTASGKIGTESAVVAGDFAELTNIGSDAKLRMIYNPAQGDNTATLSTFEGPDA